jgi:hypothetical protein
MNGGRALKRRAPPFRCNLIKASQMSVRQEFFLRSLSTRSKVSRCGLYPFFDGCGEETSGLKYLPLFQ